MAHTQTVLTLSNRYAYPPQYNRPAEAKSRLGPEFKEARRVLHGILFKNAAICEAFLSPDALKQASHWCDSASVSLTALMDMAQALIVSVAIVVFADPLWQELAPAMWCGFVEHHGNSRLADRALLQWIQEGINHDACSCRWSFFF
jgi:hypothetical protein